MKLDCLGVLQLLACLGCTVEVAHSEGSFQNSPPSIENKRIFDVPAIRIVPTTQSTATSNNSSSTSPTYIHDDEQAPLHKIFDMAVLGHRSPAVITASVVAFFALIIAVPIIICATIYHRRKKTRVIEETPPPVPPREDDGYLIPIGRQYLEVIGGSHICDENIYSYVTEPQSLFSYLFNRDSANGYITPQSNTNNYTRVQ